MILDTIRNRRGAEEEHRPEAVVVIVMRAAVMTETIAEEMTGAVGRADHRADHQADLVAQTVAADQVAAVGRETHLALICWLERPQAKTHRRLCYERWPCWPTHRPRLRRRLSKRGTVRERRGSTYIGMCRRSPQALRWYSWTS